MDLLDRSGARPVQDHFRASGMGRHAGEVPTLENVDETIAKLKPDKRAAWMRDAEEKDWVFADYGTLTGGIMLCLRYLLIVHIRRS